MMTHTTKILILALLIFAYPAVNVHSDDFSYEDLVSVTREVCLGLKTVIWRPYGLCCFECDKGRNLGCGTYSDQRAGYCIAQNCRAMVGCDNGGHLGTPCPPSVPSPGTCKILKDVTDPETGCPVMDEGQDSCNYDLKYYPKIVDGVCRCLRDAPVDELIEACNQLLRASFSSSDKNVCHPIYPQLPPVTPAAPVPAPEVDEPSAGPESTSKGSSPEQMSSY